MAYLHDLGTAPFNGGTLNISHFNSFVKIIDETSFVCAYQQTNPSAVILAIGKCEGGFATGTPTILYQEVIYTKGFTSLLISSLSENKILVWSIEDNTKSSFDVFDLDFVNNTFTRLYSSPSMSVNLSHIYSSTSVSHYQGSNINMVNIRDNVVLTTHRDGTNLVFTKITFDGVTNTLDFKTVSDGNITGVASHTYQNTFLDVHGNGTDALLVVGNYTNNTNLTGSRPYTINFYKANFGSELSSPLTLQHLTKYTDLNTYHRSILLKDTLYLISGTTSELLSIDGYSPDITSITSLSPGNKYNLGNSSNYRELMVKKLNENYFIVIDESISKTTSGTTGIGVKVIRKFSDLVESTSNTFNYLSKSTVGTMLTFHNSIDTFTNFFVIPTVNSGSLSLIVFKA